MSEKGITFLERLWPLLLALVSIGIAYGALSSRLNQAEATATKALDAIEGKDGLRERIATIDANVRTLLDRVPPK